MQDLIIIDFETSGLDYWQKEFRVESMAVTWYKDGEMKSKFMEGFAEITEFMQRLHDTQKPVGVYNLNFEFGVTRCVWPELNINFKVDVMRLVQLFDSGGPKGVFGLKDTTKRLLPEHADYEKPIYDWLLENIPGAKRKGIGKYLSKAPQYLLRAYNIADTEITMRLYKLITTALAEVPFDWTVDHDMYTAITKQVVHSKIRGIRVERGPLIAYAKSIDAEIVDLDRQFCVKYEAEILEVREILKQKKQAKYKKKIVTELPEFNMASKHHLKFLFVDVLGQEAKIKTPKLQPSFKASHLGQWKGAELLGSRGKRSIIKKQAEKLATLSEYDGRWHCDLKTVGTVTGRFAGTGGLNVQGMARRDRGLMGAMVAEENEVFVGIDFGAGEPTVTTHYTRDPYYAYATVDGTGKPPHYSNGVLMIDDIYLMYASISPVGKDAVREAFNRRYDGKTFIEQWQADSELIKAYLKPTRQLHKAICLGLGYSMGPKKLQKTLFESGNDLTMLQCRDAFKAYWKLFNGLRGFIEKRKQLFDDNAGVIVNEFGFRMTQDSNHKAFNSFIQSTVTCLLNIFIEHLCKEAPYAKFITVIHDEVIVSIPVSKIGDFENAKEHATVLLNQDIRWRVPVRTGFVTGKDLYECK